MKYSESRNPYSKLANKLHKRSSSACCRLPGLLGKVTCDSLLIGSLLTRPASKHVCSSAPLTDLEVLCVLGCAHCVKALAACSSSKWMAHTIQPRRPCEKQIGTHSFILVDRKYALISDAMTMAFELTRLFPGHHTHAKREALVPISTLTRCFSLAQKAYFLESPVVALSVVQCEECTFRS